MESLFRTEDIKMLTKDGNLKNSFIGITKDESNKSYIFHINEDKGEYIELFDSETNSLIKKIGLKDIEYYMKNNIDIIFQGKVLGDKEIFVVADNDITQELKIKGKMVTIESACSPITL